MADAGTANWPKCAKCMRAVDAYGLENDTAASIEVWARCDGIAIDPRSGDAVAGKVRVHAPLKSSTVITKGIGWSGQRFTDIIRRLAFFADDAMSEGREFTQTLTAQGIRKRHTV